MFFVFVTIACLSMMFTLSWVARPQRASAYTKPVEGNIHQVAWTMGGPSRVANMWWALLREQGVIQEAVPAQYNPSKPVRPLWSFHPPTTPPADPWLARAIDCLPPISASQGDVLWAWKPLLKDLESDLRNEQILRSADYADWRRAQGFVGILVQSTAGFVLMAYGVPFAWLLVVSAVLTCAIISSFGPNTSPPLTTHGLALRQQWTAQHAAAARAPQAHSLGFALALGGVAVLVGTPFAAYADELTGRPVDNGGESGGCGSAGLGAGCGSVDAATSSPSGSFATGGGFGEGGFGGDSGGSGGGDGGGGGCGGGGCGGGGCGG